MRDDGRSKARGNGSGPVVGDPSPNRRVLVVVGGLIVLTVFLYRGLFAWLVDQWSTDRLYSHGFIVPLVSLYLVWIGRERLHATPAQPAKRLAGLLLAPAAVTLLAGRWGAFVQLEAISFLLFLPGLILLLWGVRYLRVLIFPVLYLQFMVPWLDPVLPLVQKPFQLVSAQLSVWILKALGIPVLHAGVYLELPGITLEVARECSGVHFVLSVMAIAVPLVFLTQRSWRRAVIVLAAGAVITVLANGLRIAIDGCLGMRYGANLLHGPGHIFRGWFVAQFGWLGVFVVNWLVGRGADRNAPRLCDGWRFRETGQHADPSLCARSLLRASGALLGFLFLLEYAGPGPQPLKASLADFPMAMGRWTGINDRWLDVETMFPGADLFLSRVYEAPGGEQCRLFLGYLERQRAGKTLVSFRVDPLQQGSHYASSGLTRPWPSEFGIGSLRVGGIPYESVFWYQLHNRGTPRKTEFKLAVVRAALLTRRTEGMVVLAACRQRVPSASDPASAVPADYLDQVRSRLPEFMSLALEPGSDITSNRGEP